MTSGRWPANFAVSHFPDTFACIQCEAIHPVQPVVEVCPLCGGELEYVEGCRRVGKKKVKGDKRNGSITQTPARSWKNTSIAGIARQGHADPDGMETIDDWSCVEGCAAKKLGEASGVLHTHATGPKPQMGNIGYGANRGKIDFEPYGNDKGTCVRFYHQSGWEYEKMELFGGKREGGNGTLTDVKIICDDILHWAEVTEPIGAHAILCDPSYALSKKKKLDTGAPLDVEIETVGDVIEAYHSLQQWGDTGFMNRAWDSASVSFNPWTWKLLAKHLLPGGFGMAFASTRGLHRMMCAIEDAGLIIHPIICWLQGQGFCKATNIHSQLEKTLCYKEGHDWFYKDTDEPMRTKPPFRYGPEADRFFGHRYGRQCMKPVVEPIVVFQKPYDKKPVESIVSTGAGALNIEKARIGVNSSEPNFRGDRGLGRSAGGFHGEGTVLGKREEDRITEYHQHSGRWPPNCALSHIPPTFHCKECSSIHPMQPEIEVCPCGGELEFVEGCKRVGVRKVKGTIGWNKLGQFDAWRKLEGRDDRPSKPKGYADPGNLETVADWQCVKGENGETICPVEKLGEQSDVSKSRSAIGVKRFGRSGGIMGKQGGLRDGRPEGYNDKGTCTRFYHQSDWEFECVEMCPVRKLNEDAGERKSGERFPGGIRPVGMSMNEMPSERTGHFPSSTGQASRFYHNSDFSHETAERLAQEFPVKYCPKSPKSERSKGLDDFYWKRDKESPTGFVRVSEEEWEKLDKRERARGNCHSTVKPLSLLVWISKLLAPPPEYAPRRLLIPFSGSGSEICAAVLSQNFEEVVAIELLQDYVDISESRVAWWQEMIQGFGPMEPNELMKKKRTGQKKLL